MSKKIYVEMVADLFHYGHVQFLKKARQLGDHLTVGILSDEWVVENKKGTILSQSERIQVVAACKYVDQVIARNESVSGHWMRQNGYSAFVIAFGNDEDWARHKRNTDKIISELVVEIPYVKGISSTEIINRIKHKKF